MNLKTWAALAAATALVLGQAAPADAQKGPAAVGPTEITLRVCNNTNDNARVAISYQPVGQANFYNEGWFGVPARSCQDLRTTGNAYSYGYAEVENDGTRYWAGDFPLCVSYPGPYAFWTYGTQCETGQEVRQFVTMHAEDYGVYTWTLDPP
jgi:uncharacterized membrane protein